MVLARSLAARVRRGGTSGTSDLDFIPEGADPEFCLWVDRASFSHVYAHAALSHLAGYATYAPGRSPTTP